MKSRIWKMFILVMIVFSTIEPSQVMAATLVNDNFDRSNVGLAPSEWNPDTGDRGSLWSFNVENDFSKPGNNILRWNIMANMPTQRKAQRLFSTPSQNDGLLIMSFNVRPSHEDKRAVIQLRNANNEEMLLIELDGTAQRQVRFKTAVNPNVYQTVPGAYRKNEWTNIRVELDISAAKYDAYVNYEKVGTDLTFNPTGTAGELGMIYITVPSGQGGGFYFDFDDFKCYQGSNPTTETGIAAKQYSFFTEKQSTERTEFLVEEYFEGDIDQLPSGWTTDGQHGVPWQAKMVYESGTSGNKILEVTSINNTSSGKLIKKFSIEDTNLEIIIEAKIKTLTNASKAAVLLRDANNADLVQVSFEGEGGTPPSFRVRGTDYGASAATAADAYTVGQWNNLKIVMNLIGSTYDVYVNETLFLDNLKFSPGVLPADIRLFNNSGPQPPNTNYFDDVLVYQIIPPGTMEKNMTQTGLESGRPSAQTYLINESGSEQTAAVVYAIYKDNQMKYITYGEETLAPNSGKNVSCALDYDIADAGGYEMKVFVLSGVMSFNALTNPVTFDSSGLR